MQRLASGKQNIAPGDRTASSAVAFGMKAELASLKVGIQNGTEALNAIEMITNDIAALNDMVVRLEELNALGENGFNSGADTAALSAEAGKILTEFTAVQTRATWKGNAIFGGTNSVAFGRNTDAVNITLTGDGATSFASAVTAANISNGTADASSAGLNATTGLDYLKRQVDAMQVNAGAFYNQVSNTIDHLSSLKAGYSLDLSSKMDVDFAGETTELAKGQILAQAGTAMLAQANAQGQGMLALIQS
jgi:flagellin